MIRQPPTLVSYLIGFLLVAISVAPVLANPFLYESGADPGVGFNLVSWWNFGSGGEDVWRDAVERVYEAGFDEVSLSPVRFFETNPNAANTGEILGTSQRGPELSHVAAAAALAKSLGMRVTVNPFVEPRDSSRSDPFFKLFGTSDTWRGFYNPSPNSPEWNTFWDDYEQYIVDTATMAEAAGADSISVGTELRALARNSANNDRWASVISAADSVFNGTITYASNWDNYDHFNVASVFWQNPAIDTIGIDSYFRNTLSSSEANASGEYPNPDFIFGVEQAWNDRLDDVLLPFAANFNKPIELTEVGYLPYNGTISSPQSDGGTLDQDEQTMAFEGLMRALDGRQAAGEVVAAHVWQWDMPGGTSSWSMDPNGGGAPNNQQTAQWLSSFVSGTNDDPGDPPPPPPPQRTKVLYSFEEGLEGFFYPNFETQPASTLARATAVGATDGQSSLRITKPTSPWTWDARVELSGDQLAALRDALADGAENYLLEFDVTYLADDLPANLSSLGLHISIDTDVDEWSQLNGPFAAIGGPTDQTFTVEIPLDAFNLSEVIGGAALHLGFQGNFSGAANIYLDRIALTNLAFESGDFDEDGDVDGADFLTYLRNFGKSDGVGFGDGDANLDGTVDGTDLSILESMFGGVAGGAQTVPEPTTTCLLMFSAFCFASCRGRWESIFHHRGLFTTEGTEVHRGKHGVGWRR